MRPFGGDEEEAIDLTERRPRDTGQTDEISADIRATQQVLRQTTAEEEAHYRANDQWDDLNDRPKSVGASSSFWKGSDWTHEEKQSLRTAQSLIGVGVVVGTGVLLSGVLRVLGAQENARAGEARSDAEELATGNVTTVNQALEASAVYNYRAQVTEGITAAIAAIGTIGSGCYQYWTVCSRHAENVEKLNRPDVTKKREGLEARVQRLQEALRAEQQRLDEAMAALRLEEAYSNSGSL
jgi:hypothetical protein